MKRASPSPPSAAAPSPEMGNAPLSPFVHALVDSNTRDWHLPRRRIRRDAVTRDLERQPDSPILTFGHPGDPTPLVMRVEQEAPIVTLPPHDAPLTVRRALERAGGLAGAAWLAQEVGQATGESINVRMVRDRLRHIGSHVRKLGAGYYALKEHPAPPLPHWAAWWVHARGPTPVPALVEAILSSYPNGDPRAVHAWLHQEPSPLVVMGGRVHIAASRRPS